MFKNFTILKEEKEYKKLFSAGVINGIGDWFSQIAVLTLLLILTDSGLAVGLTLSIKLLPYLIFGPIGGVLADRYSRKKIMIVTDIIRALLILPLLLVDTVDEVWIIYVVTFLSSICNAVYSPARNSLLPSIVKKDNLLQINALEQVLLGIVLVVGAIFGGVFAKLFGADAIFIMNSISFILAALFISTLKTSNQSISSENTKNDFKKSEVNYKMMIKNVMQSALLRAMILLFALWPIGDGIVNLLISVYAVQVFGMEHIGVGVFYGALGLGLALSSSLTSLLHKQIRTFAILALILEGLFNVFLSQSPSFGIAVVFLILSTIFGGVGIACNQTIIMRNVPSNYLGSFFAIITTIENVIMGIMMALGGFLLSWLEPRTLGLFAGLFFMVVGVLLAPFIIKAKELKEEVSK